MFKHQIYINEFSWEKNIFIKTFSDTGAIGFWKYKVNNIDFYVPNMKSLVIFDSCFDQIVDGYKGNFNTGFKFKLTGNFFNTPNEINEGGIRINIGEHNPRLEDYRQMIDKIFDIDSAITQQSGGVKPSADIVQLINNIRADVNIIFTPVVPPVVPPLDPISPILSHLVDMVVTRFGCFLHNKLGLMVDQTDMQQLFTAGDNIAECVKGELIAVILDRAIESYTWAMFISRTGARGGHEYKILTFNTHTKQYVSQNVPGMHIRRVYGTISQIYKVDSKISSSDELLETYSINV